MFRLFGALAAAAMTLGLGQASAQFPEIPDHPGPRPETTASVPHHQIGVRPVPELSAQLVARVAALNDVETGPTRIGAAGSVAFNVAGGVTLANPGSIVIGREFAHMHPDGSLHASLHPGFAQIAIAKGWAIPHPWSSQRAGWEGFVMIYTPQSLFELDVVIALLTESRRFVVEGYGATN